MKEKKIINCLYGGIVVEGFLLAKKLRYLFISNIGINLMATGIIIPYWFIFIVGVAPLTPFIIALLNSDKGSEGITKSNDIEEISDLLKEYNTINKE